MSEVGHFWDSVAVMCVGAAGVNLGFPLFNIIIVVGIIWFLCGIGWTK